MDKAVEYFRKAIDLIKVKDPNEGDLNFDRERIQIYLSLGKTYKEIGNLIEASLSFENSHYYGLTLSERMEWLK